MNNIISVSDHLAIQNAQQMVLGRQQAWADILRTDQNGKVINNAGTVMYDDYKDLTTDVIKAREFSNVGITDLMTAGLSRPSDITKTLVQYQTMNTFNAIVSMDGSNRQENQSDYAVNWIPQPIYHTDFFIPWRQEGFSYKESDGISESVFRVNEQQDKVLFLGAELGVQVSGAPAPLYGYTNHPDTQTKADLTNWALEANAATIVPEAVAMAGLLFNGGRVEEPNAAMMYVATDIWANLQNDYSSTGNSDKTILDRIKAISSISDVKPQKDLVAGSVVLVELRARSVQLSVAQSPIAVPWVKSNRLEDGRFTVFSSMVAKIKSDRSGKNGVVYGTKA